MRKLLTLLPLLLVFVACGNNDVTVTNSYFGYEIKIPKDWQIQSKKQIKMISDISVKAGLNDNEKAKILLKENNTGNLLMVLKNPLASTLGYNPGLGIISEDLAKAPNVKTGEDYLDYVRKIFEKSSSRIDVSPKCTKENINKTPFYMMKVKRSFMNFDVHQEYYSTIRDGFSFNVVISYVNIEQREELKRVINTLKFTK